MNDKIVMLPINKYLIEATINWMNDSECKPHIIVDTTDKNVIVPKQYIQNNQITLNIVASAVINFSLNQKEMSFTSKFNGVEFDVFIPLYAIKAMSGGNVNVLIPLPLMEKPKDDKKTTKLRIVDN